MGRARRLLVSGGIAGSIALGLFAAGALGTGPQRAPETVAGPDSRRPTTLAAAISRAQARLKASPGDARAWAGLAIDYVAQAKATVDPSYYPKAEGAVARSLAIDTAANDIGFAALAAVKNAEHDFRAALDAARGGLRINPYSATLFGALGDAYTQLGRYDDAARAIDRMNSLLPGVPAFTRASYVFELRGDLKGARAALERALRDATSPTDVAFARTYLGELSLNAGGDAVAALRQFDQGLAVDPSDPALRAGRARALAAAGRTREALTAYRALVSAVPQPQYVLELGELLTSRHDPDAARQYALFRTEEALFRANHVVLDSEPTLFEADHGSPAQALAYARAGWRSRPFLDMADAYAWALYANRRYAEALVWSDRALATGWANASLRFHRGMIELRLGKATAARADLRAALALNPAFNPLQAPLARRALTQLGG